MRAIEKVVFLGPAQIGLPDSVVRHEAATMEPVLADYGRLADWLVASNQKRMEIL